MRAEFQEWGKRNQFGDRDEMGIHMLGETDAMRIVKNGGMLESTDGQLLNSVSTVEDFFRED